VKRKRPLPVLTLLVLSLLAAGCAEDRGDPGDEPEITGDAKVAAYIRTWGIPGGGYWSADMIKGQYLSDLIIAFALIDQSDGTSIYIPEVRNGNFDLWRQTAALKSKHPSLKISFSIGGGSAAGLAGFSDMAASPQKRKTFAANVCKWLKDYNLDGVDIDWEYPERADRENYISLLQDIRSALDALQGETGKRYGLSTAIPTGNSFINNNNVQAASEIVDGLKLMTYDYYGSWSGRTGHNANLYNNPARTQDMSTDKAVRAYLNAGVRAEKIVLGVPFYGYMWRGVANGSAAATPGLYQTFSAFVNSYAWSDIKSAYLAAGSGYKRYWDGDAKAPYLYNGDRMLSYTDQEQIRALTAFVKEKSLGGVFVWEYGHDMNAELLRALATGALAAGSMAE
jgi:chitinase